MLPALLSGACGSEPPPPPFLLRLQPVDVVQAAVNRVEIVLRPGALGQAFATQPDMDYEQGSAFSRVTGDGSFAIFLEQAYVTRHARPGGSSFVLDVPLYLADTRGAETVADPIVTATLLRREERIANGTRFLPWPLPPGGEATVMIACDRPAFARQCTNNDP
ncbi:MAG: hypothetical protein NZ898_02145 [Myxococcota bacterium]|nr:hypothetical protein [Myxococcota bacterium]MDW8361610.1 hypothetical protein [Myxococcales bacterium]